MIWLIEKRIEKRIKLLWTLRQALSACQGPKVRNSIRRLIDKIEAEIDELVSVLESVLTVDKIDTIKDSIRKNIRASTQNTIISRDDFEN